MGDNTNIQMYPEWELQYAYGMSPEQKRIFQRDNAAEMQQFEVNRQKGFQYDIDTFYPYLPSSTPYYNDPVKVKEALEDPEQYPLQVKSAGGTLNYIKFFNNAISNKF